MERGYHPPPEVLHCSSMVDGAGIARTRNGAGVPISPFGTAKRHRSPMVRAKSDQHRTAEVVDRRFKRIRHVKPKVTFNPIVSMLEPTGARSSSEIITARTAGSIDDPTPVTSASNVSQTLSESSGDNSAEPARGDRTQDPPLVLCIPASDSGSQHARTKRKRGDTITS